MAGEWRGLDDAIGYAGGLLRGEAVRLREVHESDYEQLAAWWNDPTVGVLQTAWVRPSPGTSVIELMRTWSSNAGNDVGFAVELLADEALAGHVAVHSIDKNRCGTLGIVLGPPHWSAGLGSDALRVLVRYAFAELGLHRVQLEVFAFNTRAAAAYRRLGFTEEGGRRQAIYHDGGWHDVLLMSILDTEWRQTSA